MKIIPYQEQYKRNFIELNTAWVEKFFIMEPADREILENVEDLLLIGGMIYFALEGEAVLATCMVIPTGDNVWELCKLAAAEQYQGSGAGSTVFKACIDYAIAHGAKKLTLVSNHILEPALHIYEKFGFKRVAVDRSEYDRCDIQYELIVGQLFTEEKRL